MKKTILGLAVAGGLLGSYFATADAAPPQRPDVLTAVVSQQGDLAYGIGAVSSRPAGSLGGYFVTFDRDVSHCTFAGAAGDYIGDQYAGPDSAITIGVGPSDTGDPNTLYVNQYDAALGYENDSSPFHLVVVCP